MKQHDNFLRKTHKSSKKALKWFPKNCENSRKIHFGASGGTSGASVLFLLKRCSQSALKVVPSLQKWLQQGSQSSQSWSQALLLILRVVGYPALICNCVHLQLCSFAIGQRTHLRTHRAHSLLWLRTYQKDAILEKRHIFTVDLHKHDFALIGRMPDPL